MEPTNLEIPAEHTDLGALPGTEAPADDKSLGLDLPPVEEPKPVVATVPQETHEASTVSIVQSPVEGRKYPSLYDSTGTTIIAIVLGIVIVGGIQYAVQRIYMKARSEHEILTRFVVTIVSLVVGAYITDLLIAGPDTSLLSDDEHTIILGFIKDICLMVFAFYFGTKASNNNSSPPVE